MLACISSFDSFLTAFRLDHLNGAYSGLLQNYENIDVFCSWKSDDEAERVYLKEKEFDIKTNLLEKRFLRYQFVEPKI